MEYLTDVFDLTKLKKGGAGSGNFDHAGRPGEVGGSGEGGGGGKGEASGGGGGNKTKGGFSIPSGMQESTKQFSWKREGKMGTNTVRFRFQGEQLGEKFFDSKFSVIDGKPGEFVLQGELDRRESPKDSGIIDALKPGTFVTMSAGWIGPRGEKDSGVFTAIVDKVVPDKYDSYKVRYTQISPK